MKQVQLSDTTVVVFHDNREVYEQVFDILHFQFKKMIAVDTHSHSLMTNLQGNYTRLILIFAIEDIDLAEKCYGRLRGDAEAKPVLALPHCTYLLCGRQHRKEAYHLCIDGVFDGYGSLNPIYDNHHLLLSVRQLDRSIEQKLQTKQLEKDLGAARRNLEKAVVNLDAISRQCDVSKQDMADAANDLMRHCSKIFEDLPKELADKAMKKIVNVINHQGLSGHFNKVKGEQVERRFADFKAQSDKAMGSLKTSIGEHRKSLLTRPTQAKRKIKHPQIMVVDDQEFIRQVIGTILRPKGFKVSSASDGVEALQKAESDLPDLMLLDIDMPRMSGTKVLATMKKHPELKHIPVIMLTSYVDKEHFKQCLTLGACDYIVKPTNAEILVTKIRKYVVQAF